jgi:hypothetical protein
LVVAEVGAVVVVVVVVVGGAANVNATSTEAGVLSSSFNVSGAKPGAAIFTSALLPFGGRAI